MNRKHLRSSLAFIMLMCLMMPWVSAHAGGTPELISITMKDPLLLSIRPNEYSITWKPNGYKDRCRLQAKYGGSENPNESLTEPLRGIALEPSARLREDGTAFVSESGDMSLEPGTLYGFRIVTEDGKPLTDWQNHVVPENPEAIVVLKSIRIPKVSVAKMRKSWEVNASYKLDVAPGHSLRSAQPQIIFVFIPPGGHPVTSMTGGLITNGKYREDALAHQIGVYLGMFEDGPVELGEYALRIYVGGARVGETTFTVVK